MLTIKLKSPRRAIRALVKAVKKAGFKLPTPAQRRARIVASFKQGKIVIADELPQKRYSEHVLRVRVVSKGCDYHARCEGLTASSTSSALVAARRAAAKAWTKVVGRVVLDDQISLRPMTEEGNFYARLFKAGEKARKITFEDHGQDFSWWTLDGQGHVIDCGPFQASTWCKCTVLNHATLKVGDKAVIYTPLQNNKDLTIRYPIKSIEPLKVYPAAKLAPKRSVKRRAS